MECFIIEEGVERKAELEDLLSLVEEGPALRYVLRMADTSNIDLEAAFAYLSDELKNKVYRTMSSRVSGRLKKEVNEIESRCERGSSYIELQQTSLTNSLGKFIKDHMSKSSEYIVLKETEPKEEEPVYIPLTPLESFIKKIEEASESGKLMLWFSDTNKITQKNLQTTFQNHLDELQNIRRLEIEGTALPAAAFLFEIGKIEELEIYGEIDNKWPTFLERCHTLTSIEVRTYRGEGLNEFPLWIRNNTSLRTLSISDSTITSLPDWIGELQSLTELTLGYRISLKTLQESIGNLGNLIKLSIGDSPMEELPDCIGNLKNLVILDLSRLSVKQLPVSIRNLKNLEKLILTGSSVEKVPEWLGDLQSLTELLLDYNRNIKALPDSIGNLKNLKKLNLRYSPIDKLPDTIANCTALEFVDICRTQIHSVPDFISSVKTFKGNASIVLIPEGHSLSYRCFCNCYYRLVETLIHFTAKSRREGILTLGACRT